MPFRSHPSRAFTLIELIATIAVLAAVTTVGLIFIGGYVRDAKRSADKQTLFVLNDALTRYKIQGGGVVALTSGAPIKNVLERLHTPIDWNGLTHQVLQAGKTFIGRSIDCKGTGAQYRFTRYNTYTEEEGGLSPGDLGPNGGNLVGWWKFDDGSGATAADSSGNGKSGALSGSPAWVAGRSGQALNFDMVDDSVYITSAAVHDNLASFTYSAWIYPRSNGPSANGGQIVAKGLNRQFWLTTINRISMYIGTSGTPISATTGSVWSANTWQHVAVTWSGIVGPASIKIYVNGTLCAQNASGSGTVISDTGNLFSIGDYASRRFDGIIDEVRIYNRELSGAEVSQLYNNP